MVKYTIKENKGDKIKARNMAIGDEASHTNGTSHVYSAGLTGSKQKKVIFSEDVRMNIFRVLTY